MSPRATTRRPRTGDGGARSTLVGLVLAALAVVAAACGNGQELDLSSPTSDEGAPGATVTESTTRSPTTGLDDPVPAPVAPLDWTACEAGLDCATFEAPLDPEAPELGTVELAVARRAATSGQAEGVVVVNPGGPGASGTRLLRGGYQLPGDLGDSFDLVSWDPRGVNPSTPVQCGGDPLDEWLATDPTPAAPDQRGDLLASARRLAEACGDTDGELLAHLHTGRTIADLHLLVSGLGQPVHYLGLSYGTLIGQLHLETYPGDLRSVTLDGVVDAAADLEDLLGAQAAGFEASLHELSARCASGRLTCGNGDPGASFDTLAAQVTAAPVVDGQGRSLGPAELHTAVLLGLYGEEQWPSLVAAIDAGLNGDPAPLLGMARAYHSLASFTTYAAVVCTDLDPPDEAGFEAFAVELADRHPRFGAVLANELLPCAFWPAPNARTPRPVRPPDEVIPTVVLSVSDDPATPAAFGATVADQLGAPHVVIDGVGHVVVGRHPCADAWFERTLRDFQDPSLTDAACTQ